MGKVAGNIELNEVYESKVVNIADYGVFVDLGDNIEGLIRTSELDWTNKNISPKKVLSLGDNINVKVVKSMKRKEDYLELQTMFTNPWLEFSNNHEKGDIIRVNQIYNRFWHFCWLRGWYRRSSAHIRCYKYW